MSLATRIVVWVVTLAELVGCVPWWPRLIGLVDLTFVTLLPLIIVLGYRFDDGSPRYAVRRAMKPIRHASLWLIAATAISWSDPSWCAGALVAIAIIQLFQQPRLQSLAIAATAGIAFMGTASGFEPLELERAHEQVKHWVAPMLACTTIAILLLAAAAQHLVVRAFEDGPARPRAGRPLPR